MRLINADDLKEHAQKLLVGESINTYFGINLYKMFEEIIDNTPTVEPERSQGEWQETDVLWEDNCGGGMGYDYGYYFKCSACDKKVIDKTNFCPECGATMQNGGKEE